jgi:hypothetical protein
VFAHYTIAIPAAAPARSNTDVLGLLISIRVFFPTHQSAVAPVRALETTAEMPIAPSSTHGVLFHFTKSAERCR